MLADTLLATTHRPPQCRHWGDQMEETFHLQSRHNALTQEGQLIDLGREVGEDGNKPEPEGEYGQQETAHQGEWVLAF